jgi:transposase-like protein
MIAKTYHLMKNQLNFGSLYSFMESNPTEEACRNHFKLMRLSQGLYCPHCGNQDKKIYEFKDGLNYKCSDCKKNFSLTKGTIFERTHIPLKKWFVAIIMFLDKKSLSSPYLSRELDIACSNAWHVLHRLRKMMNNYKKEKLEGVVEIDETFVGGLNKNRHYNKRKKGIQGRSTKDKAPVLGLLQRGGEIRLLNVERLKKRSLELLIRNKVKEGSIVATDEYNNYNDLYKYFDHTRCNHGAYQYVNGISHTNSLEGFWSQIKRAIKGTYHWVSRKLLKLYCYEYAFRYNTRTLKLGEKFERILTQAIGVRLMRKEIL